MQFPTITPINTTIPAIDRTSAAAKPAATLDTNSNTSKITQSFGDVLNSLNQSQANSDNLVSQLSSGGNVDLSDVMIATNENDINFRIATAMRDHLVDAYREVMRMQV
jgi:flagellar hook-basal body complex protein FliE